VVGIEFFDGEMADADWSITVEMTHFGGATRAYQRPSGGDPGPYRRVENSVKPKLDGSRNELRGFHRRVGFVHDPAGAGAITSLDFSVSTYRIAGPLQRFAVAVRQDDIWYWGPELLGPEALETWVRTDQPGLVAGDFSRIDMPGVHPDFSAAGGPIDLGFLCTNDSGDAGGDFEPNAGGVDSWRVLVRTTQP
jgi:hypothetical protein